MVEEWAKKVKQYLAEEEALRQRFYTKVREIGTALALELGAERVMIRREDETIVFRIDRRTGVISFDKFLSGVEDVTNVPDERIDRYIKYVIGESIGVLFTERVR